MKRTIHKYFIDTHSRLGYTIKYPLCQYVYGEGHYPLTATKAILQTEFYHLFKQQQNSMWQTVTPLLPLARRLASRYTDSHSERSILVSDTGIPSLCYAAVLYDPAFNVPIKVFAAMTLKRAYRRAVDKSTRDRQNLIYSSDLKSEEYISCPSVGLQRIERLYNLGLTDSETQLLLARFDSGMTLEEIAAEIGVSSRQTVLNRINAIIERCRKQPYRYAP